MATRGCRITADEHVARDAEREGKAGHETVDRLRGRRRAKIR